MSTAASWGKSPTVTLGGFVWVAHWEVSAAWQCRVSITLTPPGGGKLSEPVEYSVSGATAMTPNGTGIVAGVWVAQPVMSWALQWRASITAMLSGNPT